MNNLEYIFIAKINHAAFETRSQYLDYTVVDTKLQPLDDIMYAIAGIDIFAHSGIAGEMEDGVFSE